MLKVYTLSQCSTCRKATQWLRAHGIDFEERAIRETPPTRGELKIMLLARGGELKRLFNTSGEDYRAMKMSEKLPAMSESEALTLLAGNGRLVKRPFVIGDGVALVGFDEKAWAMALGKR